MPEFTPINKKSELTLYHAFIMIQNLAEKSVSRWSLDTFDKVLGAAPHYGKKVHTHIGGSRCDSYERKEIAEWFRRKMIELINLQLTREGKEPVDPDSFPHHFIENTAAVVHDTV